MTDSIHSNDGSVERATRIMLRPLANPLPLGFLALGAGTLVVAGLQLEWVSLTEGRSVALILLAFVFPLQLLASVLGFLARDVVAGDRRAPRPGRWVVVRPVAVGRPPAPPSRARGRLLPCAARGL